MMFVTLRVNVFRKVIDEDYGPKLLTKKVKNYLMGHVSKNVLSNRNKAVFVSSFPALENVCFM